MKSIYIMFLAVITLIGVFFLAKPFHGSESAMQDKEQERLFHMTELNKIRAEKNSRYHQFLKTSTLHCGVYHLKAGSKDPQSPHQEDEVYYVESGKAKLKIGDKSYDCKPGAILFVAAREKHFFHDIEEDLTLLVFFSTAKPKSNKEVE